MPVNDLALLRRHDGLIARLREVTAGQLAAIWTGLSTYDTSTRWLTLATPALLAGQNRAIDTQAAYLTALLGAFTFKRKDLLAAAAVDLREPFIALGRALNNGEPFKAAVEAGKLRANGLGESGVQYAARATNTAVEKDPRVVGWRRTLHAGACDWCHTISTQRYRTADSASFGHLRCNCGVTPIIGDRDPGQVINSEFVST